MARNVLFSPGTPPVADCNIAIPGHPTSTVSSNSFLQPLAADSVPPIISSLKLVSKTSVLPPIPPTMSTTVSSQVDIPSTDSVLHFTGPMRTEGERPSFTFRQNTTHVSILIKQSNIDQKSILTRFSPQSVCVFMNLMNCKRYIVHCFIYIYVFFKSGCLLSVCTNVFDIFSDEALSSGCESLSTNFTRKGLL